MDALPTVGIAKAFSLSVVNLAEEHYRDYEVAMLNWLLCKALITSPPALTNKLKSSVG